MALLEVTSQINASLDKWRDVNAKGASPVENLKEICDLLEQERTKYLLQDPDPFTDINQGRADPDTTIGFLLKTLCEDEEFMNKVYCSYMFNSQSDFELNCQAARLLLNMIPVLQDDDLFQELESDVGKLMTWAKDGEEPLRSYSCGLLEKAMQMSECPGIFKDRNAVLVPIVIRRLKVLSEIQDLNAPCVEDFNCVDKSLTKHRGSKRKSERGGNNVTENGLNKTPGSGSRKRRHNQVLKKAHEYIKPQFSLDELTVGMQQKLMLQYLFPLGEYQELLPVAFELKVVDLIYHYINHKVQHDAHLACNALLYLSSLLCHKKYIVEFISRGGVQRLLEIPQPSTVATMASLCFYYMAFSEDSIERVCLLPQQILHHLIKYLLWLLECSHQSGRWHSSLFFSMTFSFRSILNLFDSMDGLRKLANMISTLKILRVDEAMLPTDDEVHSEREMAKNACLTFQRYFEAHVAMITDECKRTIARERGGLIPPPCPASKSLSTTELQENIELIKSNTRVVGNIEKPFFKKSLELNIPCMLLKIVALAPEWNYNNRTDVIISALEALSALSIKKKVLISFCQQIEVAPNETQSGIKIILRAVEGELISDIQVQRSALNLLCNIVIKRKFEDNPPEYMHNELFKEELKFRKNIVQERELSAIKKLWSAVRLNNGIKILLAMLNIRTPITEADAMRALVCKALCGLSDDVLICQVLGKLPIFHNEQLQLLMREPVLIDNKSHHDHFCIYASKLIEKVTGKSLHIGSLDSIPTLSRLTKEDIILQTKITYPQKELLQIIHSHLTAQGLETAAEALRIEANLTIKNKTLKDAHRIPHPAMHRDLYNKTTPLKYHPSTPHVKDNIQHSPTTRNGAIMSAFVSPHQERKSLLTPKSKQSSPLIWGPVVRNILPEKDTIKNTLKQWQPTERREAAPSLDNIVTSYLREQHARCSNPVAVCPPFSLMRPHRCPEPRYRSYASNNITKRLSNRQFYAPHGGVRGCKHNRRYIYSRYRTTGYIKDSEEECVYTTSAFLPDSESLCLGTRNGDVKIVNYYGQEEIFHNCHETAISTCSISKNGKLLLTTSLLAGWESPAGSVWGMQRGDDQINSIDLKFTLPEDNFAQFSNNEEKVIGTCQATAHVYDLGSGELVRTFYDEKNSNNYSHNMACCSPGDELVLNDGILWDMRSKKLLHKFDKFNDYVSGVFHPSGLEIISNSEVWDLRTFHLLNTCPALDQCRITFSNNGDVIYGLRHVNSNSVGLDDVGLLGPYESSFRVIDAYDYSSIATIDVKKKIYDLASQQNDQILGIIETTGTRAPSYEGEMTCCRFYVVGRIKKRGEDDSDEEQEEESEEQSSQQAEEDDVATFLNNILGTSHSTTGSSVKSISGVTFTENPPAGDEDEEDDVIFDSSDEENRNESENDEIIEENDTPNSEHSNSTDDEDNEDSIEDNDDEDDDVSSISDDDF